jgi:prolyl-tRNA editing enzyme YbaK/EbsC (Cys-tRNA(Pro) deacylase)
VTESDQIGGRVKAALDALAMPYEIMAIDPAFADTAAFCARYGVPLERSGNTIVVGSKKEPRRHAACVVAATRRLDVNHTVRRLLGVSRLSFASAEETMALTGMMIGGVTPFALPAEMPVYVDPALMEPEWIVLGGGSRSTKVKITPAVFARLPQASVVPDLSMPAAG